MIWEERKRMYNAEYVKRQCLDVCPSNESILNSWSRLCEEMIELFAPKRVFECGCATGWLLNEFSKRGIEVYGADVNEEAIKLGRQYYPEIADNLLHLDLAVDSIPFEAQFFDLVIAREFIEHIDDEHLFFTIGEMTRIASNWIFLETLTITGNPPDVDVQTWRDWMEKQTDLPFDSMVELIGKHPYLVPEYPHPDNREHPNTHCRQFWIKLFQLLGFENVLSAEPRTFGIGWFGRQEHYRPIRYDGVCGLCIMDFKRK